MVRRRRDKTNDRDVTAPKAVRPRAIRYHGLFAMSNARQHQIFDEKWTPDSLTEQFNGFTDLLSRRIIYKGHESKAHRRFLLVENKRLKLQCADGRIKLQKIKAGNNNHKIRNFLIEHKDMQRLYQKMPIHLVVDNINQRTFVLRKERDRLEFLLEQRKHEYRELLLDRGEVENRIRFENLYVLEEELNSRILLKKIENSNVRLKAVRTINTTYKKMVQVLMQDEIFYEPILRSLDHDMEDQANFIKHILYLGMPAIAKFKELNAEYRQLEGKTRKNLQSKMQIVSSLLKPPAVGVPVHNKPAQGLSATANPKRYVRATQGMMALKVELQSIEKTIKELKLVTLSSQAKEIYPSIKNQVDNNEKLHRLIANDIMGHEMLETKMKCTSMLQKVLINNLSEEEINRHERVKDLRKILRTDEEFERESLEYLKNRADAYVMLRMSLWNLLHILRHVDRTMKSYRNQYPNSYLKLPLLKFEMLNMRAIPPDLLEEDIDKIISILKRKVFKLMRGYKPEMKQSMMSSNAKYHADFLASLATHGDAEDEDEAKAAPVEEDLIQENKTRANIPNRKQIKAQSARVMEQAAKIMIE